MFLLLLSQVCSSLVGGQVVGAFRALLGASACRLCCWWEHGVLSPPFNVLSAPLDESSSCFPGREVVSWGGEEHQNS